MHPVTRRLEALFTVTLRSIRPETEPVLGGDIGVRTPDIVGGKSGANSERCGYLSGVESAGGCLVRASISRWRGRFEIKLSENAAHRIHQLRVYLKMNK